MQQTAGSPSTPTRGRALLALLAILASTMALASSPASAQTTPMCGGELATIVGTPGDDTLVGTSGDDVIAALQGDDIVKGGGGDDIICGGIGNDQLFGGPGFDVLYGAQGNDLLVSARSKSGADTAGSRMFGGAGNDQVYGSTGWDRMQGGLGNDQLYGGASRDWLRGGPGSDIVDGGAWIDDMNGGLGNDRVFVDGADTARGGAGMNDVCLLVDNLEDATMRGCARLSNVDLGAANMVSTFGRDEGRLHEEILRMLLVEAGYGAPEIDFFESANLVFEALSSGQSDVFANGWENDETFWNETLPDGTMPFDRLTTKSLYPSIQGFLVTKSWAEANDVTTIDQINADEALWSQLDTDGNGKGEIGGCEEGWICDDIINSQIAFAGWDHIEQEIDGYEAAYARFMDKVERNQPAVMFSWAPSEYHAQARPGEKTMWLSVENSSVLDDSNPLGIRDGEDFCQRCDGGIGFQSVAPSRCLQGPVGCQLGWNSFDFDVITNTEWLTNNPVADELFRQFEPDLLDLSDGLRALRDSNRGDDQELIDQLATRWIAENRALADTWLIAALETGS